MTQQHRPLVLLILDGFGYSDNDKYNAIKKADAPLWQKLWASNPKTLIHTSGMAVGLPEGQMGNSEVGHMTLGAGRVVYQNFTRINKAIADGDFFTNPVYCDAIDTAQAKGKAVHILGLLSPGGVHSHEDHIFAMIEMAAQRGAEKIYLHAFLDGRDCAAHCPHYKKPKRCLQKSASVKSPRFVAASMGSIATTAGTVWLPPTTLSQRALHHIAHQPPKVDSSKPTNATKMTSLFRQPLSALPARHPLKSAMAMRLFL